MFFSRKAPARFELTISCLLDRRFNQLSHGAWNVGTWELSTHIETGQVKNILGRAVMNI